MCERRRPWAEKSLFVDHDCIYYGDYSGTCLLHGGPYYGMRCPEARGQERDQGPGARGQGEGNG